MTYFKIICNIFEYLKRTIYYLDTDLYKTQKCTDVVCMYRPLILASDNLI